VADIDYSAGTMTRSELEARRNGLSGDGAADLVAHYEETPSTSPQDPPESTGMGDPSSERPAQTCVGCGATLEGRQAGTRWCSQQCRNRNRVRGESPPAVSENHALAIPASMRALLEDGAEQVTVLVGDYQLTVFRA
jgi:hypothetical protein